MKTFTFTMVVLMMAFTGMAPAQDAESSGSGGWVIGFGASGAVPMGDFADVSGFGFGGTAWVGYMATPEVIVTARSGYFRFAGKDFFDGINFTDIPLFAGVRGYLTQGEMRVYAAGEAGLIFMSSDVANSESLSEFAVSPTLGAQFKAGDNMNVDLHANMVNIFTEGSSTTWVGFGLGLEFMLE